MGIIGLGFSVIGLNVLPKLAASTIAGLIAFIEFPS